jgi:hypothetical protein
VTRTTVALFIVASVLIVDDGDVAATGDQRDGGGQPGGASADDQHVGRGGKHEKASCRRNMFRSFDEDRGDQLNLL